MYADQYYKKDGGLYAYNPNTGTSSQLTGEAFTTKLASLGGDLNRITSDIPTGIRSSELGELAYRQKYNPDSISSSSMAMANMNEKQAMNGAGNALTSPQGLSQSVLQSQGNYQLSGGQGSNPSFTTGEINTVDRDYEVDLNKRLSLIDAAFDRRLGAQNGLYNIAFQELRQQTDMSHRSWDALAAKLNPYSDKTTSTNIQQYHNSLDAKAAAATAKLTAQAEKAQADLEAGRIEQYMAAQKEMDTMRANYIKDIKEDQRWFATFMQNQEQTQASSENQAATQFRSLLGEALPSSADFQAMLKTGEIQKSPLMQQALAAGYDAAGALSLIESAIRAQEDKTGMEMAKFKLQLDKEERMANTLTATQNKQFAYQMINQKQSELAARGIQFGTPEYAYEISQATLANPAVLPPAQQQFYNQLQALGNQFLNIKPLIDSVDKRSTVGNLITGVLPKNLASLTSTQAAQLNIELKALSGAIGKAVFGETGNLSNTDITRVLDRLPNSGSTDELRQALYTGLVDMLSSNAINKLAVDSSYYNTANYANSVKSFVDQAQKVIGDKNTTPSKNGTQPTSTFDFTSWIESKK